MTSLIHCTKGVIEMCNLTVTSRFLSCNVFVISLITSSVTLLRQSACTWQCSLSDNLLLFETRLTHPLPWWLLGQCLETPAVISLSLPCLYTKACSCINANLL